jgi:hypothetical protein
MSHVASTLKVWRRHNATACLFEYGAFGNDDLPGLSVPLFYQEQK